jgi:hypothetical protein
VATADLLLHPVRLRIVEAFSDRALITSELRGRPVVHPRRVIVDAILYVVRTRTSQGRIAIVATR